MLETHVLARPVAMGVGAAGGGGAGERRRGEQRGRGRTRSREGGSGREARPKEECVQARVEEQRVEHSKEGL